MLSKVMSLLTLPRNLRHCSQYKETNHNVRTCPEYLSSGCFALHGISRLDFLGFTNFQDWEYCVWHQV
jgi:hypothetical protein